MIERIKNLNDKPVNLSGDYVFYWSQTGLRLTDNFSLSYAVDLVNQLKKPLLFFFSVFDHFKWANRRQYQFLLDGLLHFKENLEKNGINFLVEKLDDFDQILPFVNQSSVFICDKGYLKGQRKIRNILSNKTLMKMIEVENDVIFPIEKNIK